jgi:hypothetical protein
MLLTEEAATPPVRETLLTAGAEFHVYLVPNGTIPFCPFVGVTLNGNPLQTVVLIGVITAFGSTYTITVKVLPTQVPGAGAVGVTVYVADC